MAKAGRRSRGKGRGSGRAARLVLPVRPRLQPDPESCGPTCLEQVARYYGDERPERVFQDAVVRNPDGGTMAVHLALTAHQLGYGVTVYPFGIRVFDPTWWDLGAAELSRRVVQRAESRPEAEQPMYAAWADLLRLGGRVRFRELSSTLVVRALERRHPLICGLSATWLYREARARVGTDDEDDVGGEPVGHFVVIHGYSGRGLHFHVSDPHPEAPYRRARYPVAAPRLITAILLGDVTHDAAIVEISPKRGSA